MQRRIQGVNTKRTVEIPPRFNLKKNFEINRVTPWVPGVGKKEIPPRFKTKLLK